MITKEDLWNREFLQNLSSVCEQMADKKINPHWKRVYLRLSDTAMELDAYLARCSDVPTIEHGAQPDSDNYATGGDR